jgi:hypothetical protein
MSGMEPAKAVPPPLTQLLDNVLTGLRRDVPGELGTAISITRSAPERGSGELRVLAATGVAQALTTVGEECLWGPMVSAGAKEEPIVTVDVWNDSRWTCPARETVRARLPADLHPVLGRVCGAAAMPGVWDGGGVMVLATYLDHPADAGTLEVLTRHERLVSSAITVADVAASNAADVDRVLDMLASRAVIEQAKGAIMTLRRCDASEAWAVLRRGSQQFNVKLRELAVALIEHIGQAPAQQADGADRQVLAGPSAREAAALIWRAFAPPEPHAE